MLNDLSAVETPTAGNQRADPERLLTIAEAARRLGVSASLMYRCCQEQLIPHYRVGGKGRRGKILLSPADLDAFMMTCRVGRHPLFAELPSPRHP